VDWHRARHHITGQINPQRELPEQGALAVSNREQLLSCSATVVRHDPEAPARIEEMGVLSRGSQEDGHLLWAVVVA
jgi:hypothetical protein